MTSERYFSELAAQLGRLPVQEREEALRFHREYAQEAGFTTYQELEDLSGMPLDQLTAYCLGADGVYGENGFDQLYHRFLEAPDTVLSYLALIDSREERELLCTHLASADVSWYGGTEAFGAILDRLAGESGTSGELAELIQTEWKSLQ